MDKQPLRITMLGDSLTAGFGLPNEHALPVLLEAALCAAGVAVKIENCGISGDTTTGGLARLGYVLESHPQVVLLALGANDALRGLSPEMAFKNLSTMIERMQARGIHVILLGMYAPLYLGEVYGKAFNKIYVTLAAIYHLPLYEFLLDGVALQPQFNQEDGVHPNLAGMSEIVRRLIPFLVSQLRNDERETA